jgi:hypothetical protein
VNRKVSIRNDTIAFFNTVSTIPWRHRYVIWRILIVNLANSVDTIQDRTARMDVQTVIPSMTDWVTTDIDDEGSPTNNLIVYLTFRILAVKSKSGMSMRHTKISFFDFQIRIGDLEVTSVGVC